MTRTRRIYNRHPITGGPGFQGWITSNRYTSMDMRHPGDFWCYVWIGYDPYKQFGRMRGWKNWRLRVRRRRAWKMEVRAISQEYAPFGLYWDDHDLNCCYYWGEGII